MKDVNKSLANEFHIWQRSSLPGKFVIQDIDTWPLVVSDATNNFEPICLIELKRSFYPVEKWTPFRADLPNYLSIYKLAKKANIPLCIIYHQKNKSLFDLDAKIAIFKVTNVIDDKNNWITYVKETLSANDFKNAFPDILINNAIGN